MFFIQNHQCAVKQAVYLPFVMLQLVLTCNDLSITKGDFSFKSSIEVEL